MPPIVLFIISLNLCLSFACLWVAKKIVQWRKSLTQINQRLTTAELSLRNLPQLAPNLETSNLKIQVEQLNLKLQPQIFPTFHILATTYRMQRFWRQTRRARSAPSIGRSAINPRRR